jgi:uncharacterized protein
VTRPAPSPAVPAAPHTAPHTAPHAAVRLAPSSVPHTVPRAAARPVPSAGPPAGPFAERPLGSPSPGAALPATLGVLAAANLLNNRVAPRAYVPTSVAASIALVVIARRAGCTWDEIGLGRTAAGRGPRRAAAIVAVVGAGYAVAAALPRTRPLLADGRVAGLPPRVVLYRALVRVPVGTVALEEIGFRGVLFALLRRRYGTARATLLSAALFGLWHLLPARELSAANPALVAGLGGDACDGAGSGAGGGAGNCQGGRDGDRDAGGERDYDAGVRARESDDVRARESDDVRVRDGRGEGGAGSRFRGPGADALTRRVRTALPVLGVMAVTAAGGLLFGELRRRHGGLVTPMALHSALNGWGYVSAWAVTRRTSASPGGAGSARRTAVGR